MKREIKSIVTDDLKHCYFHSKYMNMEVNADHIHHCVYGNANRAISDKEMLVVGLCTYCHHMLHTKHYHDIELQQEAERAWLSYNNKSIRDWVDLFGKNYLDEHWE